MRADLFFAEKYGSRTRAKDVLKEGRILRNGKPLSPSDEVQPTDTFCFLEEGIQYVSRGGYKLVRGLDVFGESVDGMVFADLGASTGGFTEVLLRRKARHVYAVDVGKAQLAPSLAADTRVTVMDETNARYLTADMFEEPLDGVVSDLSFISLRLVLPAVAAILPAQGKALSCSSRNLNAAERGSAKAAFFRPVVIGICLPTFTHFVLRFRFPRVRSSVRPSSPAKMWNTSFFCRRTPNRLLRSYF